MYQQKLHNVCSEVNKIIKGKDRIISKVLAAIIAGGHILMEDVPGVGKTTLATSFARALSLNYHRVQFTPDVLPSDLLGFSMYNNQSGVFEFHEGAVFCNLLLADEINRTSPKTQSALLEVMEEKQASVEGTTRKLPHPFIVIATQNPVGSSGTQLLPDSQMDRFMVCLSMGYPGHDDAVELLKGQVWTIVNELTSAVTLEELIQIQKEVEEVFVKDSIYDYIVSLVEETRKSVYFVSGASPRAAIALLKMSRATAYMDGRDFVTAEDVQSVMTYVLSHRIRMKTQYKAEGMTMDKCIRKMMSDVKVPRG